MEFFEKQQFNQKWIRIPLILVAVLTFGFLAMGLYQQLVLKIPWGNRPASDHVFIFLFIFVLAFWVFIIWFFDAAKLLTKVNANGLCLQFFPFQFRPKEIDLKSLISIQVITYSMLDKYGGYGIGFRPGGKVYNVRGNKGVLLTFKNGRYLMIGSQKADLLAEALRPFSS